MNVAQTKDGIDKTRLCALLEEYFEKFGEKPSCHQDLKPYIELEGEELAQWTSVLEAFSLSFVREFPNHTRTLD